jgi:N-acetylneuraminic acid mutarotase
MFAGVSGGALIVAGGANFPDKRPWEGGTKTWYSSIWALETPQANWMRVGVLPIPLAYGGTVCFHDEIIIIGGSNSHGHHADVFGVKWSYNRLVIRNLPNLPQTCANLCAALVGGKVVVAGGIEKPDATKALHTVRSFDLAQPEEGWRELEPWPGKERMLAVAASWDNAFYLMSGAALHAGKDGKPEREWLQDAFRFTFAKGWEKLPDLPRVAVAAPSPAPVIAGGPCIVSGDDGTKVGFKPEPKHPGFPKDALWYDAKENRWRTLGRVPFSRATAPCVPWQGGFVIPNGEARPGYRSNEVWWMTAD